MKPDPLPPESFEKKFSSSVRRAAGAARLCVERPTSDAIHEARISIRKVMAAVSLMPRGYRNNSKTRSAIKSLRLFYRACAEIRDIDTMEHALSEFTGCGGFEAINRLLVERRASLLHSVVSSGKKAKDIEVPKVKGATKRRLSKRLSRLLKERAERATRFYLSAAANETRARDLHRLRKECRRIMYLVGFGDHGSGVRTVKSALEEARTKLGAIRDDDLLLEVLTEVKGNTTLKLAEAVSASRHNKYVQFFAPRLGVTGGPALLRIIRSMT